MNEVSKPLLRVWVGGCLVVGHVEGALAEEGLGVGGHVRQVVHHHEHLDHRPQGVEEGQLNCAPIWYSVTLLTKIDMALKK